MADPIIPQGIRMQVVFSGPSGLAEDKYVNTFAFRQNGSVQPTTALYESIRDALSEFYNVPPPETQSRLGTYMSGALGATALVKAYWLGQAVPREPYEMGMSFSGGGSQNLPSEVSLCASYFAERNLPRQRGRIYIGPLNNTALSGSNVNVARPNGDLITTLAGSAKRLAAAGGTAFSWSVLSAAAFAAGGPDAFPLRGITDGWVDNAFDTQRRRGEDANLRIEWTNFPSV
jgi:hypothetical protein